MFYIKSILYFTFLLTLISCTENKVNDDCKEIFATNMIDSNICYLSAPYLHKGICVQDLKLKITTREYGQSLLVTDTLRIFKKNGSVLYFQKNGIDTLFDSRILIKSKNESNQIWEKFYNSNLNDTIYRIAFDSEILGIVNTKIYFVALIGVKSGVQGIYIHDKSDYIVDKYKKNVIRSVRGELFPNYLDTSATIIYLGKDKGVYY